MQGANAAIPGRVHYAGVLHGFNGRFYRKKYNAQQVLADFAQIARDETDMQALQAELTRVIQETLQPQSVSVWIKPTERGRC